MLAQALERDISQFGKQRDGHIKAAQKKLKAAKADVEKAKQGLKAAQQRLNEVLAEAEAAASESSTMAEQIKSAQSAIAGATKLCSHLASQTNVVRSQMHCQNSPSLHPLEMYRLAEGHKELRWAWTRLLP